MKIGIIGLGRMGCAIAHRLLDAGIDVVGFDVSLQARTDFERRGGKVVNSVAEVAQQANKIWLILKDGYYKNLDLEQITSVWLHGSIIRSWILQLAYDVFKRDQQFTEILGTIGGGQTGKWMVEEAHKEHIPVQIIEKALEIRRLSQSTGDNYATKLVAMLRHEFGGHEIKKINI